MGFFDVFRRPPRIDDVAALATFIDEQSAFIAQKGIYEFSRARAAYYAKVLFQEPEFLAAADKARWTAFPLGLAMVGEMVEGVLRRHVGNEDQAAVRNNLVRLILSVFDNYPVPAAIAATALARRPGGVVAPAQWHEPASAQAGEGHPRAVRARLLRSHAHPRETARGGIPDHTQLHAGVARQRPRSTHRARRPAAFAGCVAQRADLIRWRAPGNATPLLALDAIVLDTETTGLDPADARIVEIAGVRLRDGEIKDETYRRLVRPDRPIPAAASAVHGIDDRAVADAPPFSEIWPELSALLEGAVVVGHTLGFDLAVLKRECERAGLPWVRPRTLDTRLLAEIAAPDLAGFSLDQLAAWLSVQIIQRHSALADARATAEIFLALVPKLRDGGIRTLAEAERACLALTEVLTEQHRIGWVEPVTAPGRTELSAFRIDTHPYRHRVGDGMSVPKFAGADTRIGDALKRMARERVSSLFVAPPGGAPPLPHQTGIVTERDVLRALASHGADAMAMPVSGVMSRPLATVPADEFAYRAIGHMRRLQVRHLGVTDQNGRVVGALSARDLLKMRAEKAVWLGDEIEQAEDVPALAGAWAKLPLVAEVLRAENLSGRDVAAVIAGEISALTRRAAVLAERRLRDSHGEPPCAYAFAVLGSAGRGESLLALDQDNALVFADGAPGGDADQWFERLGVIVADILHQVGVPYCKGGVMAKNPPWRGSLLTWRDRVAEWIMRSRPQDLLSVDIFFDLRGVHGDAALATTLRQDALALAAGEAGFVKLLAEAAGAVEPGLGLFGRFRTEEGRIDLKKTGLFGIVTFARLLAIHHHVIDTATPARLEAIKALGLGAEADFDALVEAHGVLLDLLLDQQIDDMQRGRPATNRVEIKWLSRRDRERLRSALETVRNLDTLTRDLLFSA